MNNGDMIDKLEAMLAQGKDTAILRFGLGKAYFEAHDYLKASEHFDACLRHDPNYSAAWKFLGRALLEADDIERARAAFDRGLQVAEQKGDKQVQKEITVFIKKLDKRRTS